MLRRLESITYTLFLFLTPLLVTSFSKELFEFPKTIFLYFITGVLILISSWNLKIDTTVFYKNYENRIITSSLLFILLSNLIAFIFSIDHYTSLLGYYTRFNGGIVSIICILIWVLFLITRNMHKGNVEQSLFLILLSGILISGYAIAQKFGFDENIWNEDATKRVFSTLGQPNWLAAYLIPVFFIAIYFRNRFKLRGLLRFIPAVIVYIAIVLTYSISGVIAFLVSISIYGSLNLVEVKRYFLKYWYVLGLILLLSIGMAIPLRDRLTEQMGNMSGVVSLLKTDRSGNSQFNYGDTGKIRLILWDGTINLITSSPKQFLIGSGPETFAYVFPKFRPDSINATSEAGHVHNKPHNWYLEIFANLGLLGLTAYLSFIFSTIYIFIKSEKTDLSKILFCGWISILITNFFGWPTVSVSILFFVVPILMNYKLFRTKRFEKDVENINLAKIFLLFILGNSLILGATVLAMADFYYKKGDYTISPRINPFEPRYELFEIIYNRNPNVERIRSFYYSNANNPYVVKTLVNYLIHLSETDYKKEDIQMLKDEIMEDAKRISPSDRQFIKSL